MRIKRLSTFAAAVGMSLALSVSAFAANGSGSITGIIEDTKVEDAELVDENGEAIDNSTISISISEDLISEYFKTEEGAEVKQVMENINEVLSKGEETDLLETIPNLVVDESVKDNIEEYQFLTEVNNVVIKDKDGKIVTKGKATISFDIANIPADQDIAVLMFDKAKGWYITKITKANSTAAVPFMAAAIKVRTLRDTKPATLNGTTLSLTFEDIDGAAFAVMYVPKDEPSNPTGDFRFVFPAAIALVVIAGVAVIGKKKRA